jgi:hypothetical protein
MGNEPELNFNFCNLFVDFLIKYSLRYTLKTCLIEKIVEKFHTKELIRHGENIKSIDLLNYEKCMT